MTSKKDYDILKPVDCGGNADIFSAVNRQTGEIGALKEYHLKIGDAGSWQEYAKRKKAFQKEVDILQIIDHPGVPKYLDHFISDGTACIFMEYIEGETLADKLESGYNFNEEEIIKILCQSLDILNAVHSNGTKPRVYRDVKPSNIKIKPDGNTAFLDFGTVTQELTNTFGYTFTGTINYMPLEQMVGEPSPASDLFALGTVIYELIAGKVCYENEQDFVNRKLDFSKLERKDASSKLIRIIKKMTESNIKNRYPNTKKVLEDILKEDKEERTLEENKDRKKYDLELSDRDYFELKKELEEKRGSLGRSNPTFDYSVGMVVGYHLERYELNLLKDLGVITSDEKKKYKKLYNQVQKGFQYLNGLSATREILYQVGVIVPLSLTAGLAIGTVAYYPSFFPGFLAIAPVIDYFFNIKPCARNLEENLQNYSSLLLKLRDRFSKGIDPKRFREAKQGYSNVAETLTKIKNILSADVPEEIDSYLRLNKEVESSLVRLESGLTKDDEAVQTSMETKKQISNDDLTVEAQIQKELAQLRKTSREVDEEIIEVPKNMNQNKTTMFSTLLRKLRFMR